MTLKPLRDVYLWQARGALENARYARDMGWSGGEYPNGHQVTYASV